MKYLLLITTAASYFVFPRITLAMELPSTVYISEVNWAGSTSSNADEWLELTNPTDVAVVLTSWSIDGVATSNETLKFPIDSTILPHSTYLIANYGDAQSTLAVVADFITTELAISNSRLRLVLRDGSGTEINAVGDGGSPSAGASGGGLGFTSMILSTEGWTSATSSIGFDADVVQYGTPGSLDLVFSEEPEVEEISAIEIIETEEQEDSGVKVEAEEEEEPTIVEIPVVEIPTTTAVIVSTPVSYLIGTLLINEIVSDPANGNEWVEIYNPGTQTIELEGWQGTEGGGQSVWFSGEIGALQFTTVEFSNRLNNDGDRVQLLDPSGQIIDAVSYGGWADAVVTAVKKPNSIARDASGSWLVTTELTRDDTNSIVAPIVETKTNTQNTTATQAVSDSNSNEEEFQDGERSQKLITTLRIVELMANPVGSDDAEYITLENFGDESVILDGWTLSDLSKTYELTGELAAGLILTLPRSVTRIALNNDADSISLTAPDGEVIHTLSYESSKEGVPYPFDDHPTQSPALSDNQVEVETVAELVSAVQAPTVAKKKTTTPTLNTTRFFDGVVIATPGLFSSQIMYIDGLQIYQYRGEFPNLLIGDLVRAIGTVSTAYGEERLKIASADAITVIGSEEIEARTLSIDEIDETEVGRLVRVSGTVVDRGIDRFNLEEEGVSIAVVLKDKTDIATSSVRPGERYEITGVLTRYNDEMRLLPRGIGDLVTSAPTSEEATMSLATSSQKNPPWGLIMLTVTLLGLGALAWRHRQKSFKPSFA